MCQTARRWAPLAHLVERRTFNPVGRVRVPHGAFSRTHRARLSSTTSVAVARLGYSVEQWTPTGGREATASGWPRPSLRSATCRSRRCSPSCSSASARALQADTAAVLLLDEDRGVLVARAARGFEEEVRQGVQVPLARGFAGRVAAQARPIVIEDLEPRGGRQPDPAPAGHPLAAGRAGARRRARDRRDARRHAAAARVRRGRHRRCCSSPPTAPRSRSTTRALSEQRAVTEIMQRTLLPDALPEVPGVRFSAKYLPAGSGVKIGGDWYDVLPARQRAARVRDRRRRRARRARGVGDGRDPHGAARLPERGPRARRGDGAAQRPARLDGTQPQRDGDDPRARPRARRARGRQRGAPAGAAGRRPTARRASSNSSRACRSGIAPGTASTSPQRYPFPVGSALLLYTDGLVERRGESIDEGLERLRRPPQGAAADERRLVRRPRLPRAARRDRRSRTTSRCWRSSRCRSGARCELTLEARPGVLAGPAPHARALARQPGRRRGDCSTSRSPPRRRRRNAIEHAYGAREATLHGHAANATETEVRVIVRDDGRWRESRPYGRGRGLGDHARARRLRPRSSAASDGTTVTLVKRLPGAAPGEPRSTSNAIDGVPVARPREDIDAANAPPCASSWPTAWTGRRQARARPRRRRATSTAPASTCCSASTSCCASAARRCCS